MDLDVGLLRAFVVVAEELHFGRAAEELALTQQGLSKRIDRLEALLGVALLLRSTRATALTEAGQRLLPMAKDIVAAVDAAVLAMKEPDRPVRVDVLHDRLAPARLVQRLADSQEALNLEISARRSLGIALPALQRGEVDLAFGRVRDVDRAWPTDLAWRLVRLEPLHILVAAQHPLAAEKAVRPTDLRPFGLWVPNPGSATEWGTFVRRFTDAFDIPLSFENLDSVSADDVLERTDDPSADVFLTGSDVRNPTDALLVTVPIVDPVPLYAWSVVWRKRDRDPKVREALACLTELCEREEWLGHEPGASWLPGVDRPDLEAVSATRG